MDVRMKSSPKSDGGPRKKIALEFDRLIASGQIRTAFERHTTPTFRHHNPYFKGDRDSLLLGLEKNAGQFADKVYEVQRTLEDGDLVAIHARLKPRPDWPEMAIVHIFRFEGDKIVEQWDLSTQTPSDAPNENGLF